jgi:hypothetical protein
VSEPSIAAVAHLGVSSRNLLSYIIEASILVPAELKKQSILFFGPGLLGLVVALKEKVLLSDSDLFCVILHLVTQISVI